MRVAGTRAASQTTARRVEFAVCRNKLWHRRGTVVDHAAVPIDPDTLPDDPALLQQMLRELYAENDKLRLLLQRLARHQFGRRSEQLTDEQLQLGLEDLEQTAARTRPRRMRPSHRSIGRLRRVPIAVRATTAHCRRSCRAMRW
jgi:hypothetical protein